MKRAALLFVFSLLAVSLASCGGPSGHSVDGPDHGRESAAGSETPREAPPASGPARDVRFPDIARATTESGLEVNTIHFGHLPIVYLRLVIRSGDAQDPENLPGLAHFVAQMLKEGTNRRSSAELAEAVEFLGADLSVGSDEENVYVMIQALEEHVDEAMAILAEVARHPRFSRQELDRFKRRELNRLALSSQQPHYLARRTFYQHLYGNHPYAHVDTTPDAVRAITRADLQSWHRTHFVPNNAFLIAVGNVTPERVHEAANRHFEGWRERDVPEFEYPTPPTRDAREVIVVDRPPSTQSVIYVGNLALERSNPDFVPLSVANQVLGGSAASRLFMDLREQRSLTYGAYSQVGERAQVAPFLAYAAVRNAVTADAMAGFMEHLDRVVQQLPPAEEITAARRYLSDSFPLQIETASRVAYMVEELRIFGLPDDYWANFRSAIREVTPAEAHEAARRYIRPDTALIVAVGRAADIVEPLRRYGPVRVVDTDGNEIATFPALETAEEPVRAAE